MGLLLAAADLTEVNPGLIFYTIITFILVAIVLRQVAWGPILKLVEDREREIKTALETAKKDRADAERTLAESKNAIADARREAAEMMKKNREEVDRFRDELMAKSKKEADELLAQARRQINDEKTKAIAEVKGMAVDLALQAAAKLISSNLDDAKQRQLVQEYLEKLPASSKQGQA